MDIEKVNELRVDVEVIKRDIDTLTNLCEKMDKIIEKLVDHQDIIINQIYQDMDRRKADTNQDVKELHSRITTVSKDLSEKVDNTETKIMNEIKALSVQISAHNKKEDDDIAKLLKWKWTIMGGIIVISWLTSHIGFDTILKLIK
jgi:predicted RNase H-like nuclease (RuvC/YqgF family)